MENAVRLRLGWTMCTSLVAAAMLMQAAEHSTKADDALSPTKTINLFNGHDLAGLYTWQHNSRREDPHGVYSVRDGVLRISGEGQGYLATQAAYRNYHLVVEYKWGERTNRSGKVRNSGVLLHATGADGNYKNLWMTAIECQLAQGCEGDLIVIQGQDATRRTANATITSDVTIGSDGHARWMPGGTRTVGSGHQFWWSKHDPEFQELLDHRGRWDAASPRNQWTRVECICEGDRITLKINGQTVNVAYDVVPSTGKILLQNEGSEILFRTFELHPLSREEDHEHSQPK